MKTSTCTSCMGRGVETDYNSTYQTTKNSYTYNDRPCTTCSGSGVIYSYSPPVAPIKATNKPATPTKANPIKTSTSKKTSKSDFSMNDFFMLVGCVIGGFGAYQLTDNWIAIGLIAIISGVLLRVTYKIIFVLIILATIFYFYNQ